MHLWERFGLIGILNKRLSKWFKLVKICMVTVLGGVKDECTFLSIVFMKTKLWNHLMIHLDQVVWMYAWDFYNYGIFYVTMKDWQDNQILNGVHN
jgi:hypothetical protein